MASYADMHQQNEYGIETHANRNCVETERRQQGTSDARQDNNWDHDHEEEKNA